MNARRHIVICLGLALILTALIAPVARADFGIKDLSVTARNEDESIDLQAGTHPYEYTVSVEMNQGEEEKPEGKLSELIVDLPPGLIGNPLAMPRCTGEQFEGFITSCPGNTQIGIAHINVRGIGSNLTSPVYNLTPPLGVPFSAGFSIANFNSFQEASIRTGGDYGATVSDITIPTELEIISIRETIWGVPADEGHFAERQCINSEGGAVFGCSTDSPKVPFLTLPTSCTGPLRTTVTVHSLEEPENPQSKTVESLGEGGTSEGVSGCERPPFNPTITTEPETSAADSPSGLHVHLHLPQNQDPEGIATAHLKDTVVTLPQGLAINPSTAGGLEACSLDQIDLKGSGSAQCPPNSEVGTVKVETPLLDHPVPGSVFIARQGENPFGSLIALYVALNDPISGVIVKLAGRVEPDPITGRLQATFKENPQLPFEDFDFEFFGGSQASLTTPPICGSYITTAQLTPWTAPAGPTVTKTDSFQVASAPGGGPCAPTEAQMPNNPSFEAGAVNTLAGSFSPFVTKLTRENGSQRFSALNVTLPPGVSAKLAGVQECSEAQIAAAQARGNPGQGALEKQSPSCPASSQVGIVNVGAGSGSPIFVQGTAYLAGPYKGAPLSLAIITPAVAGPFDLGVVVVRAALYVNEETGQGTVKSDQLPTILQGIPLDVRSIAFQANRPDFTLNPTSCDEKQVSAEAISTAGQVAHLNNRFQVGGCKGLDYTPKLSLSLKGATKRSGHPTLRGVLTQPKNQANNRRLVIILPPTEFIDPLRTANPCTRPQFAEGNCPPASILGKAKVFTPILDKPLEGKIYFRANGGVRELPDAVADLHGQIHVVSVGFIDAVHKKGSESSRVRITVANIPDAPVSKLIIETRGGKKGTFVNSANLCKVPPIATVKMTGQNNKAQDLNQRIGTSCGKKKER